MSSYVFKIATQEPEKLLAAVSESLGANSRIARQVAEQMPKPAIKEPTEFGSVVRAFICGHTSELWVRTLAPEYSGWTNVVGKTVPWQRLCEVEVLRVGIEESQDEAEGEAFKAGVRHTVARGIRVLDGFRDQAITAERKDAYQNAINVLREIK